MAPRRIVCCKTCRKRFTTASGSTLCLSCRPKEVPRPQLTYGGNSLTTSPSKNEYDAQEACSHDNPTSKNDPEMEEGRKNEVSNVSTERSCTGQQNNGNGIIISCTQSNNWSIGNGFEVVQPEEGNRKGLMTTQRSNELNPLTAANTCLSATQEQGGNNETATSAEVCHDNKSLLPPPKSINDNRVEDDSIIQSCFNGQDRDMTQQQQEHRPSSKKQKFEMENVPSDEPTFQADAVANNSGAEDGEVGAKDASRVCSDIMPTHKSLDDTKEACSTSEGASNNNELLSSMQPKARAGERSTLMQKGSNEAIISLPPLNKNPTVTKEKKRKHWDNVSPEVCEGNGRPSYLDVSCPQSAPVHDNEKDDDSAIETCDDGQDNSMAHYEQHHSSKKQKVEVVNGLSDAESVGPIFHAGIISTNNHSAIDTSEDCSKVMSVRKSLDGIKGGPHSPFKDENVISTSRIPRVSLNSAFNDSCNSGSDDEMDIMIAQGPIWKSRNKHRKGATSNEVDCIGSETMTFNEEKEDGDSDSDIEFLGTSSESQVISGTILSDVQHNRDDDIDDASPEIGSPVSKMVYEARHEDACQACNIDGEPTHPDGSDPVFSEVDTFNEYGSTMSDGLNLADNEIEICHDVSDTSRQLASPNSPKKDVCYICGADLTRITTGLKGRVAHMKRCSAKYGKVLGERNAMNNDGGFDADFVAAGAEEVAAKSSEARSKHDAPGVNNPYSKDNWHGDANSELELNKPMTPTSTKPKQSMLKQFFKAPVRSLTNVLLAGAKQAAKGKAIVASQQAGVPKSGKKPYRRGQWNANNNRRSQNLPGFKRITGTDFVCDGFHYARRALSENYFLTHFHSDHYGGITKTWSEGTIFCSLPTANLVHQQLGVDKRWLHPIPMNSPTVIASKDKPVTVTLLDANHCPGAIMFLFEFGNRKILHVGDFRWNREIMMKMPQLRAFSNSSPRLDELFFDTTYCNEKYALPTQDEAISAAIEVAENEMTISKKDIKMKTLFLFGSYTIGKEKIYLSVAKRLKMKVYVDGRRYRILSSLEWPKENMQIFTTKKSESSLWVVPLGSVNFKQMRDYMDEGNKNKAFAAPYGRVVGFRPTGWTFTAKDKNQRTLPGGRPKPGGNLISSKTSGRYSVHGVPYSEHSSFPELVDCLRCLKPKKIIPTVSVSKSEAQIELLLNALQK